ncbi:MAG TPA: hypothetical protein VF384_02860 [Planctomycetota bacterium]
MLLCASAVLAQTAAEPHVGYAHPAGLQQGTTGEVVVGGRTLQGVTAVVCSGRGITAEVLAYTRPLTNQERNKAREQLQQLEQKRRKEALTPEETATATELRRQLAINPRQQPNPQIAEMVRLRLTVAADAVRGAQDLRLLTPAGLSNPLRFEIGDCREHGEREPNDQAADRPAAELPVVLNGQILPGDVDRFVIRARQGMHLVAAAECRALVPYLADAVPGWFQAVLELYDAAGREVAYADDHRFAPDPLLTYDVPADGDYVLAIRDAIWRGREDFVYRVAVGELPFVTAGADLVGACASAVPFAFGSWPEVRERAPDGGGAQRVELPVVVNGVVERPGEQDVFEFAGKAGDRLVAEVLARRLGSPLDSVLRLSDARGRELEHNDDHPDASAGLLTHQADSWLQLVLPADGVYRLVLADAQQKAGPDHGYRLRVGSPQPDFALRITPSALNVRAGATAVFTVHALRQDGYAGDITLELVDAPAGFTLGGACVPGNSDKAQLTLKAPPVPGDAPVRLQLEGRTVIGKKEVRRRAVPADDMMQAFAWHHLVPADEFLCAVLRGGQAGVRLVLHDDQPVRLPAGGTAAVRLDGEGRRPLPEGLEFVLRDPPAGIRVAGARPGNGGVTVELAADGKTAAAGMRGNLIVDVFVQRTVPARDGQQKPRTQRNRLGTLPAIPFAIVAR